MAAALMNRPLLPGLLVGLVAALFGQPGYGGSGESAVRFEAERVIAFGDVHGAHDQLLKLLHGLEVIDDNQNWIAGSAHLVSLGDLLDRGPDSRRTMDLLMKLQAEASAAGGRVHVVLGNHELMNLTGDMRYVSAAEYAAFATSEVEQPSRAPDGETERPPGFTAHRQAFAPEGKYGRWLLQQPSVAVINDTAFVHAGLSPLAARMGPAEMEREFKSRLGALLQLRTRLEAAGVIPSHADVLDSAAGLRKRLEAQDDATDPANSVVDQSDVEGASAVAPVPAGHLADAQRFVTLAEDELFSYAGPLWYRGTARCHHLLEAPVLENALQRWEASRVVVGHTPTPDHRIRQRFQGRAILADTGMLKAYYKGQPAALILGGPAAEVYYPETQTRATAPDPVPELEIDGLGPGAVLAVLREGVINARTEAPGPDGAVTVTVTAEGRQLSGRFQAAGGREIDNELAAYALDRLLQLGIAAPVVARSFEGREGTLSALGANAIDEAERAARGRGPANWCGRGSIFNVMYAWDALINNEGRGANTMIYDPSTWQFMSTGHGRAFGRAKSFPDYLKNAPNVLPEGFARALRGLDEDGLNDALGDLLSRRDQRALLKRRDLLLERWTSEG